MDGVFRPRSPIGAAFQFAPASGSCSRIMTERPVRASSHESRRPTGPAPAMTTS